MNQGRDDREIQQKMQLLDEQISNFQKTADPAAQSAMRQIVQTLLEFHATGIERILDIIDSSPAGPNGDAMIGNLAQDKLISSLLLLHDLHPHDLETRVRQALDRAQPYLASHGGHVELTSISPQGVVHLRLEGSCHGCPSSQVTLRSTIEQEIYDAAPEITSIVVEGLVESLTPEPAAKPDGFVPINHVGIRGSQISAAAG